MRIFLAGLLVAIMAAGGLAGSRDDRSDLERGLDQLWSSLDPVSEQAQLCHYADTYGAEAAAGTISLEMGGDRDYWFMAIVRHCDTSTA